MVKFFREIGDRDRKEDSRRRLQMDKASGPVDVIVTEMLPSRIGNVREEEVFWWIGMSSSDAMSGYSHGME